MELKNKFGSYEILIFIFIFSYTKWNEAENKCSQNETEIQRLCSTQLETEAAVSGMQEELRKMILERKQLDDMLENLKTELKNGKEKVLSNS